MSSLKTPEDPEADTGSGWFGKTGELTPAEERAREAEYRWAVYAKKNDLPGPTRVRVYITRAPPGFAAGRLHPPEHGEDLDKQDERPQSGGPNENQSK